MLIRFLVQKQSWKNTTATRERKQTPLYASVCYQGGFLILILSTGDDFLLMTKKTSLDFLSALLFFNVLYYTKAYIICTLSVSLLFPASILRPMSPFSYTSPHYHVCFGIMVCNNIYPSISIWIFYIVIVNVTTSFYFSFLFYSILLCRERVNSFGEAKRQCLHSTSLGLILQSCIRYSDLDSCMILLICLFNFGCTCFF